MAADVDLPLMRGIEELKADFTLLSLSQDSPPLLAPDNGFASREEAQTFIDNSSQERDPDEQQLLNLYAEYDESMRDVKDLTSNSPIVYENVTTQITLTTTWSRL